MSKTLRRILAVPSRHALRNDSKRHVTPISANHFSFSFETVANAPNLTGTTVTLRDLLLLLSLLLLFSDFAGCILSRIVGESAKIR